MASESDTDAKAATGELTRDDVLELDDGRCTAENVAVVTGAASGIGRATATALAVNGLSVVATDLDGAGLDDTASLAADLDAPGRIVPVEADLTDDDAVRSVVDEAAAVGTVRYLANVAGLQHIDPIEEFSVEKFDLLHDVMVRAPFLLAKLTIPEIRATDDGVGAIGNMCSIHGHVATQDKVGYVTSKFGLRGLTRSIAAEGDGAVRAFTVSTSYVKTPLVEGQIPDTARERDITEEEVVEDVMLGGSRVKEMMTPVEVANLFTFGFSEHGRHLNGGDLPWDGGHLTTYE
jgi:3-hydroxybutyrate dehydrogenase